MGNCASSISAGNGSPEGGDVLPIHYERSPLPFSLKGAVEACRDGVVVLSGCGGGYDVVGSSPLLYHLQDVASDIILTNLTFTNRSLLEDYGDVVPGCDGRHVRRIRPGVFYQRPAYSPYFPEALFANASKRPVYAITRDATLAEMAHIYVKILACHDKCKKARAIFLAKGGSDVLFTGDERGDVVPAEDMVHLRSVLSVPAEHRAVLTLGFDISCATGRGVVPSDVENRLGQLRSAMGLLFEERLTPDRDDASYYCDIVRRCDPEQTVIQSLVCASIEGHRGLYTPDHLRTRIGRNVCPLTDRTATMFGFDMDTVASGIRYLDRLPASADIREVRETIKSYKEASRRRLRYASYEEGEENGSEKGGHHVMVAVKTPSGLNTPLPPLPEDAEPVSNDIALSA